MTCFLASCSTVIPSPGASPISGTEVVGTTQVESAPLSQTPGATATASPPASRVIGPDNFHQVAMIKDFGQAIDAAVFAQFGVERNDYRVDELSFSPDGSHIAIGGCTTPGNYTCYRQPFIFVIDVTTDEISSIPENDSEVFGLAFSPNGRWMAYAVCPLRAVIWDMDAQMVKNVPWQESGCAVYPYVVFSPDSSQLALSAGTRLIIFDVATGAQVIELAARRYGFVLPKFNQDGTRLAVFAAEDGRQIAIYDTTSWQRIRLITVSDRGIGASAVDYSLDGKWLVTIEDSEDADPVLWDATTGEKIAVLDEPMPWLSVASFSPDGRLLIVGGNPSGLGDIDDYAVWDPTSLQRLGTLSNWDVEASRIMFAADGKSFLTGYNLYSLPGADMLAAEEAVTGMMAALAAGDYQTAAEWYANWYQPHLEIPENTDVYADAYIKELAYYCDREPTPCMTIQKIHHRSISEPGFFAFQVSFIAPVGSTYPRGVDNIQTYEIDAAVLPDGSVRVIMLPYFFYYPE